MTAMSRPLAFRLKVIHGFGAVAFGVKDSGFSFFLLLYYSQVLGMDAGLVGLVLLCALLIDAAIDPILGYLSDRTYTRWGRRLPWLYLAPLPLAFAWIAMWSPPGDEAPTALGLLAITATVRILLSACEVPSISLVPEITADYDERTTLFRYRYLFGWLGGVLMMALAYTVFLPGPQGLLDADGYFSFGLFGAALMAISVIGSAWGQHRLVAHLPATKPEPFSISAAFVEIREAFSEKAFLIFAAGGLAAYVSQGMTFSISNYLNIFVWQFDRPALNAFPLALFASVVGMFLIVGPMHKRWGKPRSAAIAAILSLALIVIPLALLLLGGWPEPGTLPSTLAVYAFLVAGNMFGVVVMISASSMIAEIVEAFQERTGRRAEGSFYSGNWLVQKCATGLGIAITGRILSTVGLNSDAEPAGVPGEIISEMVQLYAGAIIILGLIAAFWLNHFPIRREDHERRLASMREANNPQGQSEDRQTAKLDHLPSRIGHATAQPKRRGDLS